VINMTFADIENTMKAINKNSTIDEIKDASKKNVTTLINLLFKEKYADPLDEGRDKPLNEVISFGTEITLDPKDIKNTINKIPEAVATYTQEVEPTIKKMGNTEKAMTTADAYDKIKKLLNDRIVEIYNNLQDLKKWKHDRAVADLKYEKDEKKDTTAIKSSLKKLGSSKTEDDIKKNAITCVLNIQKLAFLAVDKYPKDGGLTLARELFPKGKSPKTKSGLRLVCMMYFLSHKIRLGTSKLPTKKIRDNTEKAIANLANKLNINKDKLISDLDKATGVDAIKKLVKQYEKNNSIN